MPTVERGLREVVFWSIEIAGLGGDSDFLNAQSPARWYVPVWQIPKLGPLTFAHGWNFGHGLGFGMGVGVYRGGVLPMYRSVGSYGWGGAAGTNYFADPKEDLILCIFSQVFSHMFLPGCTYIDDFERLVYQAIE